MNPASQDLAILFADVSGSTALYEKLGDQQALAAIDSVLTELKKSVVIQKGRVVKTIGDELMAALPSANNAMLAACDMQNRVMAIPPKNGVKLAIRIGFHFGPVIEDEADFYGDAVNLAARMAELAKAGQIITSLPSVKELSALLRKDTRDLDSVFVKGKQEEIRIFEILWQHSDDLTMASSPLVPDSRPEPILTLSYGDKILKLGTARPSAAMGRDAANDLVTADKMASRVHAKIEYRRGQFFLADQSTNGTYVTFDGDAEIMLKREQIMLRGRGGFCFGHSAATDGSQIVSFAIE
jgi:class 3 adenylate cyclase